MACVQLLAIQIVCSSTEFPLSPLSPLAIGNSSKHTILSFSISLGQQPGFKQVKFSIKSKMFLLDCSIISLSLYLFDWDKYKTAKGAFKIHILLDFDGNLPAYVNIINGQTADNKGAYQVPCLKEALL